MVEYDYERGEGNHVNSWDFTVKRSYSSIDDLVKDISRYGFSDDVRSYLYFEGRLETDVTVDEDNNIPSDNELEAWRNGDLMLYNAHLSVDLEVGCELHTMTEDEAADYGIPLY